MWTNGSASCSKPTHARAQTDKAHRVDYLLSDVCAPAVRLTHITSVAPSSFDRACRCVKDGLHRCGYCEAGWEKAAAAVVAFNAHLRPAFPSLSIESLFCSLRRPEQGAR